MSYFRVFGCKCFILNKKPKTSKFAPKVNEGFLLGYGSNEHAYRVFNKTSGRVEIAVDMPFDESNGSQVEQVNSSVVGNEEPPCEVIKQLAIGDIRPQEVQAIEVEAPHVVADLHLLLKYEQQCCSHKQQCHIEKQHYHASADSSS